MMKLLITSVGSLLGQNILDAIESRRNQIVVIGTNSMAENPRNFRCDTVYLVSPTNNADFSAEFERICAEEKPDLILPGRDEDSIFLSEWKESHPDEVADRIPCGRSLIPRVVFDKYQTHLFCRAHQLPFADTFLYSDEKSEAGLDDFLAAHGFPVIVKPREGFGSNGVFFILNREQAHEITQDGETLFQEYLGDPSEILKYRDLLKRGIPLFFQIPETKQYAAQTVIAPDGSVGEVFITVNTMVFGRCEYSEQIHQPEVEKIVRTFVNVFFEHGWYGSTNFQLKPDGKGGWKVYEMNTRLTGTSSARVLLGYDEFGILANIFAPALKIPNLSRNEKTKGRVIKYLSDNLLLDENVKRLRAGRVWKRL